MTDQPTTTMLGEEGEPCSSCGFPLATDQRYCLNCGTRRSEPRLDYMEYVSGPGGATSAEMPATPAGLPVSDAQPVGSRRDASPLVAVGGIGILGLMLLVGVLIGRGGGETQSAPAVVQVPSAGAPVAAQVDTAPTEDKAKAEAKKASDDGGSKGGGGGGDGSAAVEEPEQISTDQLEALENTSGDDYSEAAEKLPDTIQLPGEPPPRDNVDPGGGTDANVIE